ncbi:MAG: LamG-like jellyroll fold domain-containing protein [Oligoflexus sp.]
MVRSGKLTSTVWGVSLLISGWACSDGEGFDSLEEAQSLASLNSQSAPIVTKLSDKQYVNRGDILQLFFRNELTGDSAGVSFSCSFDMIGSETAINKQNCDDLPGEPASKFNQETGALIWGPVTELGEYTFRIQGVNRFGSDTSTFLVIVQENKAPRLARILDQNVAAGENITLQALDEAGDTEDPTVFACTFDQVIDERVVSDAACRDLPGEPAIKFDTSSGIFSWTPSASIEGVFEILITAKNSTGSDSKVFVIEVGSSQEKKIRLTYVRDQYLFPGEPLQIDVNNLLTGDDEGVIYSCYYDAVIDGNVAETLSCDLLPGTPAQKFNSINGQLSWTPSLQQETEVELRIKAIKQGDEDNRIFVASFSPQRFGEIGNSAIIFEPNSWDFGAHSVNTTTEGKNITLTNNASAAIHIGSITINSNEFILNWSSCPESSETLASLATCVVNVGFKPVTPVQLGASLTVRFGKTEATASEFSSVLGLSGRGVGQLSFDGLQSINNVTHNSLTLNWDETPQASSFTIFRVDNQNMIYIDTLINTSGTVVSKTITGLQPSSSYTFRVRAADYIGVMDNNTNDVSTTTAANRAPSVSPGPANWNVYTGRSIAAIDFYDNFTSADLDRDGDIISYTCRYDQNVDGTVDNNASLCTSIVNIDATNPSFNQFTGILSSWKPAAGSQGQSFEFKVTASDFYGANSSAIFATTVQNGSPLITGVSHYTFPDSYLTSNQSLNLDFDNIRFSPFSDIDMTYTCSFRYLAPSVVGPNDCSTLPGSINFNSASGVFQWSPQAEGIGAYEFTVSGTNLVGSHQRVFDVSVGPNVSYAGRLLHLEAAFAGMNQAGQNNPNFTSTWLDLSETQADASLNSFDQNTAWAGNGSPDQPVSLNFAGNGDYVSANYNVNAESYLRFETWIKPQSMALESALFSFGDELTHGAVLTDRRLYIPGNYKAAVLADNPEIFWSFDEGIVADQVTDISGNGLDGDVIDGIAIADNATQVSGKSINLDTTGYITPATGSYSVGNNWTIETWIQINSTNTRQVIASSSSGNSVHAQIVSNRFSVRSSSGDRNGSVDIRNLFTKKWNHLVVIGSGDGDDGQTSFYLNGQLIDTVNYYTTLPIARVGNFPNPLYAMQKMDNFAIYSGNLSAQKILDHYEAAASFVDSCLFGNNFPVGYWYHLSGILDADTANLQVLLDGQEICNSSIPASTSLTGASDSFQIGKTLLGGDHSWQGELSSLVMYQSGGTEQIHANLTASQERFADRLPLPAAGMMLWLRADQGLFQDAEMTTAATQANDPIAVWQDMSLNSGDVHASNDNNRPLLKNNGLNGHPVIEFDGINDYLRNFVDYSTPNTIFLVARYSGEVQGRILAGASNNWLMGFHASRVDQLYTNGWVYNPNIPGDNEWKMYGADHSADHLKRFYRNNTLLISSSNGGTDGPNGIYIGTYREANQASTAEVAEVIIYNRVLSSQERSQVFDYLNERYQLY